MALTTRIQKRFLLQRTAFFLICLIFGLLGIYDYTIKIPREAMTAERGQVYRSVRTALETWADPSASDDETRTELTAVDTDLAERLAGLPEGTPDPTTLSATDFRASDLSQWKGDLITLRGLVGTFRVAERGTPPAGDEVAAAVDLLDARVARAGDVTPPSKFDRLTQWAFILCLPFAPFYAWQLVRQRRIRWTLHDDGALEGPMGRWEASEIVDIRMDAWMRKSIASVVHADGREVEIDDYVHRGGDEIVGTIAHRLHPDAWTPEAKPVRTPAEDAEDAGKNGATEDAAPEDETAADDETAGDESPRTPAPASGD